MIFALWFLWGLYWAVAALRRGPVQRRQPPLERLAHLAVVGAGSGPYLARLTRSAS